MLPNQTGAGTKLSSRKDVKQKEKKRGWRKVDFLDTKVCEEIACLVIYSRELSSKITSSGDVGTRIHSRPGNLAFGGPFGTVAEMEIFTSHVEFPTVTVNLL